MSTTYDYLIKLLILGDSGVGKYSLVHRFINNIFRNDSIRDLPNFEVKVVNIDGKMVKIQLWNPSNYARFGSIPASYLRGVDGVIFVYDATDQISFKNIEKWDKKIESDNVSKILVSNKSDLIFFNKVSKSIINENEYNMQLFYVSAKDGTNVETAFNTLIKDIIAKKF